MIRNSDKHSANELSFGIYRTSIRQQPFLRPEAAAPIVCLISPILTPGYGAPLQSEECRENSDTPNAGLLRTLNWSIVLICNDVTPNPFMVVD